MSLSATPIKSGSFTEAGCTIEIRYESAACVVTVTGELERQSAPLLLRILRGALAGDHEAVLLDLARLDFIDAGGLGCLLQATSRSRANGDRLRIVAPTGHARRVFELTRVGADLPLVRD